MNKAGFLTLYGVSISGVPLDNSKSGVQLFFGV